MRRLLTAAVTLLLAAGLVAAGAPSGDADHLDQDQVERATKAMDALGKKYGDSVGHGDLWWFADMLDVPVGTHVNDGDLDRVVREGEARASGPASAYEALASWFSPFGLDPGTTVNEGDVARLGREVGVPTQWPPTTREAEAILPRAEARADEPHPLAMRWGRVLDLSLLSTGVELIGFHQANHDGARDLTATDAVPSLVMESRGRGTGLSSAADVVTAPGVRIFSPVTGTVKRAGTYTLYCRHSDDFMVVEPDGLPGVEVKLLHIDGVQVRAGQRVVAGVTPVAKGPTPLPFSSQVDDHSSFRDWPHVHVEVVDTSIPDRPNGGSGSGGC